MAPRSHAKGPRGPGHILPFLAEGGGQCGEAIRNTNWDDHILGPIAEWPFVLQFTLGTILRAQQEIYVFWGEHHISFYNDAYMPAFGAGDQTAALGREGKILWRDIWNELAPQIEGTMARGESSWHEDQMLPYERNGRIETTYWTYGYSPLFIEDGTVGGALITCMETTKRVLSDRRLRASQQLSASLIHCRAPKDVVSVLMTTIEQNFDDIAQVTFDRLGEVLHLPESQASQRTLVPGAPQNETAAFYTTKIGGGPEQTFLGTLRFEVQFRVVVDELYIEFLDQLTDRISAAIENMYTRLLGDIFFNLPDRLLCIASTSGYLTRVSPGFVEALGYDAAYLTSAPFTDLVHPDDLEATLKAVAVLENQESVINFTNRCRGHDGNYRWFSWVSRPNNGLIYCVVHDITELKSVEEKLIKALDARDDFLSIASHELKTPITSLKLYSQLVERQYAKQGLEYFTTDKIERLIRMLLVQSDRLGRLVEDMLDISRIAAGRLAIQHEPTNLTAMVEDVTSRFELQAKAVDCAMVTELEADVSGLLDTFRIEQVLNNLLTNALRYAPGAKVCISLVREGQEAVLRVADAGPGIPPIYRNRIFQRFERFVSSSEVSGLGLGLYISQQIVAAHGGAIHLDTSVTAGACFVVRLPLNNPGDALKR